MIRSLFGFPPLPEPRDPMAAAAGPAATIEDALHDVYDPETGLNIVDLGLVYGVDFVPETGEATVTMTFTTPACPAGDVMEEGVHRRLRDVEGVKSVNVNITFDPPWTPARISPEGRARLGWG